MKMYLIGMNLPDPTLSEGSQTKKVTYCIIWISKKAKLIYSGRNQGSGDLGKGWYWLGKGRKEPFRAVL